MESLTEEKKREIEEALINLDLFELKELLDKVEEARKKLDSQLNDKGSDNNE